MKKCNSFTYYYLSLTEKVGKSKDSTVKWKIPRITRLVMCIISCVTRSVFGDSTRQRSLIVIHVAISTTDIKSKHKEKIVQKLRIKFGFSIQFL